MRDLIDKAASEERVGRMVRDLLRYYPTEQQKRTFLRNRIDIYLRSERGRFFDRLDIMKVFGIEYNSSEDLILTHVWYSLIDIIQANPTFHLKYDRNTSRMVYPREGQHVYC